MRQSSSSAAGGAAPSGNDSPAWTTVLLLAVPPLCWATNFVVGRAVRDDIPPMMLSTARWSIALLCLLPFTWRAVRRDLPRYWQLRWQVLRCAVVGVAAFNTLIYAGLHWTTASNALLLNSFIPILIALFGVLLYGQRMHGLQAAGMALSFLGVLNIALHGEWARLAALSFSRGDLLVFAAMVCWALYTLWLRRMPADLDRVAFTTMQIALAVLVLVPLYGWEYSTGARPVWGPAAVGAMLFVGLVPSVLAYLVYAAGVARAGPARAGLFLHLMPVFGAVLSVVFLRESLHLYHAAGMAAIFGGIAIASMRRASAS